jgi:probable phosphoglycerate mutase
VGIPEGSADLELVFDGGALGNPGAGYGSFQLRDRQGFCEISRLDFGDNVTNNQAEYRTLIAGLEAALKHAGNVGWHPRTLRVRVRTDSKLVVEQVLGRWKVRHPNLQPLSTRARDLLSRFGSTDIAWHPRVESVRILGH